MALFTVPVWAFLFPCLRAGTFIEAGINRHNDCILRNFLAFGWGLSLRYDVRSCGCGGIYGFPRLRVGIFVAILNMNREVSRGLRSPGLETTLVSRLGLFSLKHEDRLNAAPATDSSCLLSGSEMTKLDARNPQQRYGEVMSREKKRLRHRGAAAIIEERPTPLALFRLPNLNLPPCLARSEPSLRDQYYIAEVAVAGVSPATNIVAGAFSEFWSSCKHDLCRGTKFFYIKIILRES